jgi:inorganic pyrophosphatase
MEKKVSSIFKLKEEKNIEPLSDMSCENSKQKRTALVGSIQIINGTESSQKVLTFIEDCEAYLKVKSFSEVRKILFVSSKFQKSADL